jgi:hypothetical protein
LGSSIVQCCVEQNFDRSQRRFTTTSPETRTTTTDIDTQGRPTREAVSGIEPLTSSYRPKGLLETQTQGARSWSYTYEPSGSSTPSPTRSSARRASTTTVPAASPPVPGNRQITCSYDDNGNLETITPPSKPAHVFTHKPTDLLQDYVHPAIGTDPTLPRTTPTRTTTISS